MRIYLAVFACVVTIGSAQSQDAPAPSELPPVGFAASTYVDAQGCAFSRAEMNGAVLWVARRDAARRPICDESPTFARAEEVMVVTDTVAVSVSPKPLPVMKSKSAPQSTGVPRGYRKVWGDDRLNPNRGPRTASGDAAMARVWSNKVPMTWIGN